MKKDKICINKTVAFVLVGILFVSSVILLSNYFISQNYSTKSKAAASSLASINAHCTYQGHNVPSTNRGTEDRPFNYFYDPATFCIVAVHNIDPSRQIQQPLPYKCNTTDVDNFHLGYSTSKVLADGVAVSDPSCQATTVKTCSFGNKTLLPDVPVKIGAQTFSLDWDGCILQDNSSNGWRCQVEVDYSIVKDVATCPNNTGPIARTACLFNGQDLTTTTPVIAGVQKFTIDTTGCIMQDGYRNGLKCDAATKFVGLTDKQSCPVEDRATACSQFVSKPSCEARKDICKWMIYPSETTGTCVSVK